MAKDSNDRTDHRAAPVAPAPVTEVHTNVAAPAAVPTVQEPAPPQRQTLPVDKQPNAAPGSTSAPAITSESNFNQARTEGEKRASDRAATMEAEQQKAAHPGGLPLPTSGQPLTKPEPDADYGTAKK